MSRKIFSENLKYLMDKRKISVKDLADKLNVNQSTVGHWRNGKVYPAMSVFIDLCDILDYPHVNILTINIQRAKLREKKDVLPEEVSNALQVIIQTASGALKK